MLIWSVLGFTVAWNSPLRSVITALWMCTWKDAEPELRSSLCVFTHTLLLSLSLFFFYALQLRLGVNVNTLNKVRPTKLFGVLWFCLMHLKGQGPYMQKKFENRSANDGPPTSAENTVTDPKPVTVNKFSQDISFLCILNAVELSRNV